MKNKKETKKTKKTKTVQKTSLWANADMSRWRLGNEQKIVLSNVFVGLIIAGILTLLNYLFGDSKLTTVEALLVALGTIIAVVLGLLLRKEKK